MASAKKKSSSASRPRARAGTPRARAGTKDGPKELFVAAVREHDFACAGARDAWNKTKFVTLMLAWLVGERPTARGTSALERVFDHVRGMLAPSDRRRADAARGVLQAAASAGREQKNRAAFELAELRDRAVVAKRPSLAAFVDALAHTAEALASHADGDDSTPLRRGIEVGRSLLFAVAERRVGDGEDREARAEASRELAEHLRKALSDGP